MKRYLREASATGGGSRHLPAVERAEPVYRAVSKAIRASDRETNDNPRSRSATLRHAIRTDVPARVAA